MKIQTTQQALPHFTTNSNPAIVILLLLLPFLSFTQSPLQKSITTVAKDSQMKHASLGVCIMDAATGEIIAQNQAETSLIPASTMKAVTTATALAILGPNYRYQTTISYDGRIVDGILEGNVYIKGTGDPSLGSDQMEGLDGLEPLLEEFRLAMEKAGIKGLNGYIVGDGSHFETAVNSKSWQWNDIGNYYGAGVSGLNIHENLYYLNFDLGGNLNTPPQIKGVHPPIPYVSFTNELKSAGKGSGDNAYIYGAPFTYHRYIRGTLPIGDGDFEIKGSVPDPPYFAAFMLNEHLVAKGMPTKNLVSTERQMAQEKRLGEGKRYLIHTHQSPRLQEIVNRANRKSVNLYCEALLKTVGYTQYGEGSTAAGERAIVEFWETRGMPTDGWVMEDGSGLSPRNTMTARQLAMLLSKVSKDAGLYPYFYESLPVAGESGTIKNMLKGTSAAGNLRAKSGSMSRVRCYVGYVKTKSGRQLSFAILSNNFLGRSSAMRKRIETIMAEMAEMP